jgi:hypothetical protein
LKTLLAVLKSGRYAAIGGAKKSRSCVNLSGMIFAALTVSQISVRRSCGLFCVSQTCYRYAAKSRDENKVVVDSLIALSLRSRTWGVGLMFLHLRNVQAKRNQERQRA